MTQRKTYHVTRRPDGDWQGKLARASRASVVEGTKAEAIEATKELAKKATLGQIVIHRADRVIQTEHTYGNDPRKYPG